MGCQFVGIVKHCFHSQTRKNTTAAIFGHSTCHARLACGSFCKDTHNPKHATVLFFKPKNSPNQHPQPQRTRYIFCISKQSVHWPNSLLRIMCVFARFESKQRVCIVHVLLTPADHAHLVSTSAAKPKLLGSHPWCWETLPTTGYKPWETGATDQKLSSNKKFLPKLWLPRRQE